MHHLLKMKNVGIIGAGTMGIGIAQVAATNGCKVWVYDANPKQVETATVGLEKTLSKLVDKQKISSEKMVEILSNISIATELKDFKDCELIIEAIIENKEIKTKVFTELETHVSENCIIHQNTFCPENISLPAGFGKIDDTVQCNCCIPGIVGRKCQCGIGKGKCNTAMYRFKPINHIFPDGHFY